MRNFARLSSGFMFTSAIGLIISFLAIYPYSETWGIALGGLFGFMLVAAIISFTHGPVD